jgi:hypothetical protein
MSLRRDGILELAAKSLAVLLLNGRSGHRGPNPSTSKIRAAQMPVS